MPQLSKSRHQRSICAGVTRAGSSTNDVSMRASYQPVSQRAAASSWLRPRRLASTWMLAIDTPNALLAVMPNRARFSRSRWVLICSSDESAAWTSSWTGRCAAPRRVAVRGSLARALILRARRPGPLHERVVRSGRALEVERGGGEEAVAPRRRHERILQHRGAELVVVGVVPLEEISRRAASASGPGSGCVSQAGEHLARGGEPVAAHLGEDLLDGGWPRRRRAEPARACRCASPRSCVAAEQRQERGVLEQQQPARLVVAAAAAGVVQGVGGRRRVQRDDARLAHQQLAGAWKSASRATAGRRRG